MSERVEDPFSGQMTVFNEELKCFVESICYNPANSCGAIVMLAGNCCSMTGAINLFKRIDPEVRKIITYSGATSEYRDTAYAKVGDVWQAFRSDKPRHILSDSERMAMN